MSTTRTLFDSKNGVTLVAEPTDSVSGQTILILTMNRHDNRFSEEMVAALNSILDILTAKKFEKDYNCPNPILLITGSNKFFSNGLDLEGIRLRATLLEDVIHTLSRILILGMPTIACINGHAFGGGLFLSLVCDWRIMRKDRGFLCFPETDLKMPFSWGFANIATDKIGNKQVLREAALLSKRYPALDALKNGLIDQISMSLDVLIDDAKKFAYTAYKGKNIKKSTYSQMKFEMYPNAYLALKNWKQGDSIKYMNGNISKL